MGGLGCALAGVSTRSMGGVCGCTRPVGEKTAAAKCVVCIIGHGLRENATSGPWVIIIMCELHGVRPEGELDIWAETFIRGQFAEEPIVPPAAGLECGQLELRLHGHEGSC